jgi:hypothetical protein
MMTTSEGIKLVGSIHNSYLYRKQYSASLLIKIVAIDRNTIFL